MSERSKSISTGALGLLLPSLLAMAWLVTRAKWFWNNQPDLEFGWVVLMLCAYLFYEAWEKRPAPDVHFRWWVVAALIAGAAILLFVLLTLSLSLILDLDRPWRGGITISQQPMIDLVEGIGPQT